MSPKRNLLLTMLLPLLAVGHAAATGPDDSVKVHAILIGNTKDANIGKSVEKDMANMEATLRAGFDKHKDLLDLKVLKGDDFTLAKVQETFRDLKADKSETVFVFFACHGGYMEGAGHTLVMDQVDKKANVLLRSDLQHILLESCARLTVILTDTCNNYPRGMEERPPADAPDWETIRCLFLVPYGLVDINSVTEGESAYGDSNTGGFFTSTFTGALRDKFAKLDLNHDGFLHWAELVPRLQSGAQEKFERMRRDGLHELTDDYIKQQPKDDQVTLMTMREHLRKQATHGVRVYALPPVARFGVRVIDRDGATEVLLVEEFTPAARAGLKPGDVIKKVGDRPVKDVADFLKALDSAQGEVVVLFLRGSDLQKVPVQVAPWPVPPREG